jgi:hypothetical protein
MRGSLRIRLILLLVPLFSSGGCQKRGAAPGLLHPALTPADATRERLVARLLVPSFDRTSATVDQMRSQGALPFGAAELRNMLLARLSLPEDALSLVDTGRPIALAVVSPAAAPPTGESPLMVAGAFALKAPEGAGAFVDRLGTLIGSDREVFQLRRRDGEPIWVLRVGQNLAWASTREALVEAGAHALDGRVEASDDLVLTSYPGPWARSHGIDLRQGHAPLRQRLMEEHGSRGGRPRPAAERAALEAVLDFVLRPAPETDAVEARLVLGKDRGADVSLRVRPRPGSPFAARTAVRHPYSLESAPPLGPEGPTVTLAAVGEDPAFLGLLAAIVEAQAKTGVDGAGATAERLRPLVADLSGSLTGVLRPAGSELAAELMLPLRPAVPPARVQAQLGALAGNPGMTPLLGQVYRRGTVVRSSKEGDRTRVEIGSSFTVLAGVASGKLLLVTEPQAAEKLNLLAGSRPPARPAADSPLAAALEESRGRDGVLYVDVLGVIGPVMSAVAPGAGARMVNGLLSMPGVSGRKLPIWLSFAGGDALAVDLRLPLETLTTAAGLMGFFGRDG